MMLKEYKDFKELEQDIREEFTPLLSVKEVQHILSCGAYMVIDLIKADKLKAYHLDGSAVNKEAITYYTFGLRITPSSLRDYLESIKVK